MDDTRFDGLKIYRLMSRRSARALFDIRGRYIHSIIVTRTPEYEIRGDFIHISGISRPMFEIQGNKVRKVHSTSQAVYEIR